MMIIDWSDRFFLFRCFVKGPNHQIMTPREFAFFSNPNKGKGTDTNFDRKNSKWLNELMENN